MHPELFKIPFTPLTVQSYGLMMVIGFLSAVYLIRRLSRNITPDQQLITNAALYSLIAGVAELFCRWRPCWAECRSPFAALYWIRPPSWAGWRPGALLPSPGSRKSDGC